MSRRDLVDRLVVLAGNVVTVVDPGDGWPSLVRIRLSDGDVLAAAHLGPIGLSHRDRDDVERRFQNPGKGRPMSAPEGPKPASADPPDSRSSSPSGSWNRLRPRAGPSTTAPRES